MALKITIDPGHGQYDNRSPNNSKYIEGTQMWHLANQLKTALEKYGFEVVTTRPKITDNPSLSTRGSTAGGNGSSMFLSLHSNAPGKSADGTYSATPTGTVVYYSMTRSDNKALADKLGKKVAELMGHYYRGSLTRQYPGKPGVDYYGVIRAAAQSGCKCAMLIEHGFHTNVFDSNFLLVESNLQRIADAEAAIIADYFGQTKTGGTTVEKPAVPTSGSIYRVQTGAFGVKANADKLAAELKAKGFDTYIVKVDNLYKVQVGAYVVKANADAMAARLKKTGYDNFITTNNGNTATGATTPAVVFSEGDKVKCNAGVKTFANGVKMASWVPSALLYVRKVESGGKILLVSTEKTKAVYTGRVNASDVHKI